MSLIRLDELILKKGLVESRSMAQRLISEGKVIFEDGTIPTKPGKKVSETINLELLERPKFVSRAGEKVEAFIDAYSIEVTGKSTLDVGASTGGFTDCLLQKGATSATCVDVGHSQLHPKLLNDERVSNHEGINARNLTPDMLPQPHYPLIVMDLSFISIRLVLPALWPILETGGTLISLIKPQFEASKEECNKTKGIIKDPRIHQRILKEVEAFILGELPGAEIIGQIDSPIKGGDGNKEFLIGINKKH